jgi:hypothetical protein
MRELQGTLLLVSGVWARDGDLEMFLYGIGGQEGSRVGERYAAPNLARLAPVPFFSPTGTGQGTTVAGPEGERRAR